MHFLLYLLAVAYPAEALTGPRVLARLGDDRFRQVEEVRGLTYSPDGKHLASIDGHSVIIWDARDGQRVRTISLPDRSYVDCFRYSTDGRSLYLAAQNGQQCRLFQIDPASGRVMAHRLLSVEGKVSAVSPSGRYLKVLDRGTDRPCNVVDTTTGKGILDLGPADIGPYLEIIFRPDDKAVSVRAKVNEVVLYDLEKRAVIGRSTAEGNGIGNLVFTPDGRDVVARAVTTTEVLRCEVTTGKVKWSAQFRFALHIVVSPDGRAVHVWGARTSDVPFQWHSLDLATGRPLGRPLYMGYSTARAIHPAGHTLASAFEGHISQWDLKTGRQLDASADPPVPVTELHFTPEGRAVRGWADAWYEWDLKTGKQSRLTSSQFPHPPGRVCITRDLRRLARCRLARSREEDGPIGDWRFEFEDTRTGSWRSIPGGDADRSQFRFLPTGLLLSTADETWTVMDPITAKPVLRMPVGKDSVAAVTDDGRQLATLDRTTGGFRVTRWDTITGRRLGEWFGPLPIADERISLSDARLTPDGRTMIVSYANWATSRASADLAFAFDVGTGAELGGWMQGMGDRPAFFRDGRSAAICSPMFRMLDIREFVTGDVRRSLRVPVPVMHACVRPDGRALLAATRPYPVEVWSLPGGPKTWNPKRADDYWQRLADADAGRAYTAILALRDHPVEAIALLKARMTIPMRPREAWLKMRLAGLDAPGFKDRERASADLAAAGETVVDDLRRALPTATAEARARLEKLLEPADDRTPDKLRAVRACEVLEAIGTREARALLEHWAGGTSGATLTREARASVRRLSPGPGMTPEGPVHGISARRAGSPQPRATPWVPARPYRQAEGLGHVGCRSRRPSAWRFGPRRGQSQGVALG